MKASTMDYFKPHVLKDGKTPDYTSINAFVRVTVRLFGVPIGGPNPNYTRIWDGIYSSMTLVYQEK